MTLLLREVSALVAGAALWLAAVTIAAVVPAYGFALARRRRPSGRDLRAAVAAGLLLAAILSRLGLDDPLDIALWRRPLPLTWVLAGAVAGTLLAAWRPRHLPVSDRAAR